MRLCFGINIHVVARDNFSSVCELNKQKGEDRTIKRGRRSRNRTSEQTCKLKIKERRWRWSNAIAPYWSIRACIGLCAEWATDRSVVFTAREKTVLVKYFQGYWWKGAFKSCQDPNTDEVCAHIYVCVWEWESMPIFTLCSLRPNAFIKTPPGLISRQPQSDILETQLKTLPVLEGQIKGWDE